MADNDLDDVKAKMEEIRLREEKLKGKAKGTLKLNFPAIISAVIIAALLAYYFFPEKKLPAGSKIDRIVVFKSKRKMNVYSDNKVLKTYHISISRHPGKKQADDDDKTPEGSYKVDSKVSKSGYYMSLHISYPNPQDVKNAKKTGRKAGGGISIHGLKKGFGFIGKFQRLIDWTSGSIAVTDQEMDELYKKADVGTAIEIKK